MKDRDHFPFGKQGSLHLMPVENPTGPEQRAEQFGHYEEGCREDQHIFAVSSS